MEYLKELNPRQLEAATATEGYIRVVAGAGSGKTKTLTARYLYLVEMPVSYTHLTLPTTPYV